MAYGLKRAVPVRIVEHLKLHPSSTFTNEQLGHALGITQIYAAQATRQLYLNNEIDRVDDERPFRYSVRRHERS